MPAITPEQELNNVTSWKPQRLGFIKYHSRYTEWYFLWDKDFST